MPSTDPLDIHEVNLWARGPDIHGTQWYSRMSITHDLCELSPGSFWHVIGLQVEWLMGEMQERDVLVENIRWEVTVDLMTIREKLEYTDD